MHDSEKKFILFLYIFMTTDMRWQLNVAYSYTH